MKSLAIFLVIIIAVGAFFGFFIHSLNEDERERQQRSQEWLQFSQAHHCHVARESSFANPSTLWECDGFEVQR